MTHLSDRQVRQIIKTEAEHRGAKYRITKTGQVDFYGCMPNTNQDGWYFMSWGAADYARQVLRDIEDANLDVRALVSSS